MGKLERNLHQYPYRYIPNQMVCIATKRLSKYCNVTPTNPPYPHGMDRG